MRYILTKLKFINMLDFIGSRAQYCSLWGFYNPEKPSFKKKEWVVFIIKDWLLNSWIENFNSNTQ